MSNKTPPVKCQENVSVLEQSLNRFHAALKEKTAPGSHLLHLKLSPEQKALAAAWWPTPPARKIVITDAPPAKAQALLKNITAWDAKLKINHRWHLIPGPLTEQELSGQITTKLSHALHALLTKNNSARHHFVLPASLLDTPLPNPQQYQQQHLTLTAHEEYPLGQLVKQLTKQGYQRHHRSLEPGTFIVKGENITVNHPYHPNRYTLTFHRQTIEQIIRHNKRNETIKQVTLPPLGFPPPTTKWNTILPTSLVIRPAYLSSIPARYTIIDNSLHPVIPLPIKTAPLEPELAVPQKPRSPSPVTYQRGLELIQEFKVGRPAVHSDHGIGIYEGLAQRTIAGQTQEYLILRYAEGDTLSVPVIYAHKVTSYIGEGKPPINRLSDATWQSTKRQAGASAAHLARELLQLARRRSSAQRPRYITNPAADTALNDNIPYTLTPDQTQAWHDVQNDLQQSQPMDRLIVGDVGFGKTEIAIRAASLATSNNRQVALLAPTTLLVQQHFDTLLSRLPGLASKIALLSRFSTSTHRTHVRQGTSDGTISIVIGTHGLLSPHLKWHNLGLVIIDEEQRFGVEQKEHFKKLRAYVDILSLSATPIPRTLSLALSGLKTLSIIATPPAGRQDVTVTVGRDHDATITQAIKHELSRGGQTYVVAPRVRQLPALQERLHALLPKARLACAHGQMNDSALAATMHQFDTGQIDILISSTIIASGLDIPNANTMIIIQATHFGLADLYQLRGRIGRRKLQGHVHFLYNAQKLTPLQRQRLTALTEAARLGSGWQLARRDLELRGAGNLLGAEQSGAIQSVGLALYLNLVREATQQEQGHPVLQHEVDIHLPLAATIPVDYIVDLTKRTRWYGRLTRADTAEQLTTHTQQLQQAYGPLPPETKNLLLLLQLRQAAAHLGITKISSATISPPGKVPFQRLTITPWPARGNAPTLEATNITPHLIQQLLLELKRAVRHPNHRYKQPGLPFPATRNSRPAP